jgi:hypothetical protein
MLIEDYVSPVTSSCDRSHEEPAADSSAQMTSLTRGKGHIESCRLEERTGSLEYSPTASVGLHLSMRTLFDHSAGLLTAAAFVHSNAQEVNS